KKGTTIIVTTHIMDEAEFCERLGLIREGKLVATGTTEELKKRVSSGRSAIANDKRFFIPPEKCCTCFFICCDN
ncbi:hypothetical protein ACT453_60825, partial [Bacillus sp. D-CC]